MLPRKLFNNMIGLRQTGRTLVCRTGMLAPSTLAPCVISSAALVRSRSFSTTTNKREKENRELVEHVLNIARSQRALEMKSRKAERMASVQRHSLDTGTPEAQVAGFTARIENISAHLLANRQDKSSLRLLQSLQNKRRKELIYLRRTKPEAYLKLIKDLGLNERRLRITPKKDQHRSR